MELIIEVDLDRKLVFPNIKLNNIPAHGRVIVSPKNIQNSTIGRGLREGKQNYGLLITDWREQGGSMC